MPVGAVPFPFGKCRICKDRATGVHYGVATCEGCKGFFKRSITKAEKYKCFFGDQCDVTPKNRNRCKSCRFRLCLEHGMSVEAVRMGRIPKIEKEKALEAAHVDDGTGINDQFKLMAEDVNDYLKYSVSATASHTGLTGCTTPPRSAPSGPDIYDFDTGFISRQNRTIAEDSQRIETITQPFEENKSFEEELAPLIANAASMTSSNTHVKTEVSSHDTSCDFSLNGSKGSSNMTSETPKYTDMLTFEIHEDKKHSDMLTFEKSHNTYQYSNILPKDAGNTMATNTSFVQNTDRQYGTKENVAISVNDPFQADLNDKPVSDTTCSQNQMSSSVAECLNASDHKTYTNLNQFPSTESSFGSTFHHFSSDPGSLNQVGPAHDNSGNRSMSLTAQTCRIYKPSLGGSIDLSLHHKNDPQKQQKRENHSIKQEPTDEDFSDSLNVTREGIPLYETNTQGEQDSIAIQKNLDEMLDNQLSQAVSHSYQAQVTMSQLKASTSVSVEFSRPDRPPSSLSFPPTCPTPSSVDGSTTSSQRGRFSPGLIKVLLEHVLDSTQDPDVSMRLKQRLEKNSVDKNVVANVLNLIREVSAKRNKVGGSEETMTLSMVETGSNSSSALPESKMENIQRFLEDVSKFSRPECLQSPPYSQRLNTYYSIPNTAERQNTFTDRKYSCPPIKKRICRKENMSSTAFFEEGSFNMGQNEIETRLFDLDNHSIVRSSNHLNKEMAGACTTYSMPEVTLSHCEQSIVVGSSQHRELADETYPNSCELIDQSINENAVTCSDDKLSKEEVKKQVVQMTLEGLSFASKILYRLKPEHREKLRLWKLGLVKIRVLSVDTAEDMRNVYKKIINGIPSLNERILGFCEQVPGFSNINSEDREVLMKRAYYDIWMLTSSEYFTENDVNIILESGEIYCRKAMEKILNKEITSKLIDFASQFNKLNLSDLEIAILCAIRLTCSDDLEVKDRSTTQKLHSLMLDVLAIEIEGNHPENHARLLISIFQLIPSLALINKLQCQIIAKFRLDKYHLDNPGPAEEDKRVSNID